MYRNGILGKGYRNFIDVVRVFFEMTSRHNLKWPPLRAETRR